MPATKKKTAKKSAKKPAGKPAPKSHDHSVTSSALKLVDEAAALLRKGISTGSDSSEKARLEARKKAHTLLSKASTSLSDVLDGSASILRKVINKI
ncbi:MAG: hypothetical protein NTV93_10715 [Verrucomicrobia bacterium]|nr:hypothetical protein [Verrucomicrobiota bacterium]